jgi:hypothetical protein
MSENRPSNGWEGMLSDEGFPMGSSRPIDGHLVHDE